MRDDLGIGWRVAQRHQHQARYAHQAQKSQLATLSLIGAVTGPEYDGDRHNMRAQASSAMVAEQYFRLSQPRLMLASSGQPAGLVASAAGSSTGVLMSPAELAALGPFNQEASSADSADVLIGIEEVQKSLSRSRASVYRYTNTDPRNLNPPFNPRKLNPEYRSDQKDPLLFHPNEVARFARDVLRIKEVTVEVLNSPSTATQQLLSSILDELRQIRAHLDSSKSPSEIHSLPQPHVHSRPAA